MDATTGTLTNVGLAAEQRRVPQPVQQPLVARVIRAAQTNYVGDDQLLFVGNFGGQDVYRKVTAAELAQKRQMHAIGVKIGKVGAVVMLVFVVLKIISLVNSYTQ